MPLVFDEACLPLQPGAISEVTPSPFGYHICKVLERAPARQKTFEEMQDALSAELLSEKRRVAKKRHIDTLLAQFETIHHKNRMKIED